MEIATVGSLHPGRFSVAFGHGVEAWMRQIGARPPDRLVALEETVRAVRDLLAGRRLTVDGAHVHLDGVELERPPTVPPRALVGTTGERGLALAGRAADGVVLPEGSGAEVVRWARGRSGGAPAVVYAWLSLGDDDAAALDALRPAVEAWRAMGLYPRLTELAELPADASAPLSADQLRRIAVAGRPAACAEAVQDLWQAGAASVVLVPVAGDPDEALARFAADVLPRLRRGGAAA
jgi:alkanesulfonate monooxygenase SsuD/methylene tetrahydromethanopterin reductase-like flavin-dependent oxidoreductase (luciferase family)